MLGVRAGPQSMLGVGVQPLTFGSVEAVCDSVFDLVSIQLSVSVGVSPLSSVTAASSLENRSASSAYRLMTETYDFNTLRSLINSPL